MNFEKKSRKEGISVLRQMVIEGAPSGGEGQRCRLLAYAFLRGRPYATLERKTNEDRFPRADRNLFLKHTLSWQVAYKLSHALEFSTQNLSVSPEIEEVRAWIFKKYESEKEEEVAA